MQVTVQNENTVVVDVQQAETLVVEVDQGRAGRGIENITYQQQGQYYYLVVTYTDGTTETLGPLVITGAAVSLLGGTAGAIAYQTAPDTTGFLTLGTQNQVVVAGATAPQYTSALTGLTVNNSAIGNTAPSTGAFTNLSASGTFALTGDQVQISEGGTGQTTANGAFNALAPSQTGNAGKYLKTDGTNTAWDQLDISTADITGTLPIANGGTGQTTANSALNALLPTQTAQSGKYLKTDGTNASWDQLDISTADITGVLPVANGGTGASTAPGARANLSAAILGTNNDITSLTGITGGISTPDFVQFDTTVTEANAVGKVYWDAAAGTLDLGLLGGNVITRIGQTLVAYVTNAEAVTITKGQAVYLFSAQGNRASVKLASNLADATSAKTFGVVAENIPANGTGFIMCQGVLEGLNLGAYTAGDTLYLGATPGSLTATKPYAPNHLVYVGLVERANAGNGQLYVKVQNGYELDEIHDVQIINPQNGQTILYDASTSLWKNANLTAGTGISVTNGAASVTIGNTGVLSFSGGTTGLTPAISTTGAVTLGGTLAIGSGGTGQTTANASFNALAPSQTGNAGKYLKTDGTNSSWDLLDISTSDITGTLPVANGGTGATTAAGALTNLNAVSQSTTISAGTGLTGGGDLSANRTLSIANTTVTAGAYGSASETLTATVNAQGQLTALAATPIAIANTQISGLGTMSTQNASSVSITGGTITGITDLAVADGGTGASDASTARSNLGAAASATTISAGTGLSGGGDLSANRTLSIANTTVTAGAYGSASNTLTATVNAQGQLTALAATPIAIANTQISGLGTMSTQNSNSVTITGGSITGITDLAIADGGTGASTASGARTNLGLGTSAVLDAGVALGVATLDAGGTVPLSQLPASIQGGVSYQGSWDAATNTPTIVSSVGSKGYYYVVSVAGSTNINGITDWLPGDWIIFNGSVWQKIDNTDAVASVNGYTGVVVLNSADVGAPPTSRTITAGTGLTGGGDLSANRTISIANTTVAAGSYGSASSVGTFTVNGQGQLTAAASTPIAITNTQVSGLGTMSTQNANSVAITGGSITGITDLAVADGGTGASDAATARTNLGAAASATTISAGTGLTGGGDLSANRTLSIANTTVTAASYGSASSVGTFTVNAQGQLTAAASTPIAIANTQVSGLGTMSTQNANAVAITGGSVDGTTIGGTTRAAGSFTTLTLTNALGIANGGTGQTTANAAFNALAPSQTGNAGKYLTTDGTNTSWATNPLGTVTSVDVSGGTTGLTTSGGPITSSGTITLGGTLGVANGGTGTTTAFTAGSVVFAGASGVYSQNNSQLFWDNTNTRLGIGTATPTQRFHVEGGNARINNGSNSTILFLGGSPSANWEGDIQFVTSNNQINWRLASNRVSAGAFTITPSTAVGGSTFTTPALTIDSASNVGIGTNNPAYLLHVLTSSTSVAAFRNSGAASAQALVGNTAGDLSLRTLASGDAMIFADTGKYLAFGSNGGTERGRFSSDGTFRVKGSGTAGSTDAVQFSGSAPASAMTLDSSGRLLVGQTLAGSAAKAQIGGANGTTNAAAIFAVEKINEAYGLYIGVEGSGTSYIQSGTSNDSIYYNISLQRNGGNVGIGTSSPVYKLTTNVTGGSATALFRTDQATADIYLQASGTSLSYSVGIGASGNGLRFLSGAASNMLLDSSGNLGLGVTPDTWFGSGKAFQLGFRGDAVIGYEKSNTFLTSGMYYVNGTGWVRDGTQASTNYQQRYGVHTWNGAAAGADGSTISTINTFMTLDASGNLGVGVTNPTSRLDVSRGSSGVVLNLQGVDAYDAETGVTFSSSRAKISGFLNSSGGIPGASLRFFTMPNSGSVTERVRIDSDGTFRVKGAGTAGSTDAVQFSGSAPASALTLTSGGDLYIGTTTNYGRLTVQTDGTNGSVGFIRNTDNGFATALDFIKSRGSTASPTAVQDGDGILQIRVVPYQGSAYTYLNSMAVQVDGTYTSGQNPPTRIAFNTNVANGSTTERARITSGGYFKASNNGTYVGSTASNHEFSNSTTGTVVVYAAHSAANPNGYQIYYSGAAPNGTGNEFLYCSDTAAQRASIRSNGGLANYSGNDVNLSDRREKTNFAPAKSYLDTICAIPVQTFNYIDQSEDDPGLTLGVVAQDVQAVAPELVMESNWGTEDNPKMRLSIYQTDLQYALMKCIQEQQAIITDLRARVAQLEAK